MNKDQIEGIVTKVTGKAEEIAGRIVHDGHLEGKGYLNQAIGAAQEGYGKVREKVKDLIDEAPEAAKEAIDKGRDYARKGSEVVVRTGGANTALVLLAAGAAGAALGWLAFRRRSRNNPDA